MASQLAQTVWDAFVLRVTARRSARRVFPAAIGPSLDAAPAVDAELSSVIEDGIKIAATIVVRVARVPSARTAGTVQAEPRIVEHQLPALCAVSTTVNVGNVAAADVDEAARAGRGWATFERRAHGVDQLVDCHVEVAIDVDRVARIRWIDLQKDSGAAHDLADAYPPIAIAIAGTYGGPTGTHDEPDTGEKREQHEPSGRPAHSIQLAQ